MNTKPIHKDATFVMGKIAGIRVIRAADRTVSRVTCTIGGYRCVVFGKYAAQFARHYKEGFLGSFRGRVNVSTEYGDSFVILGPAHGQPVILQRGGERHLKTDGF